MASTSTARMRKNERLEQSFKRSGILLFQRATPGVAIFAMDHSWSEQHRSAPTIKNSCNAFNYLRIDAPKALEPGGASKQGSRHIY